MSINEKPLQKSSLPGVKIFWILVLILFMTVGTILRYTGINWDQNQHLHPDERFLTMVETAIQPVESISEYFNTDTSTLNPHNVGYGFYVYGTFPIFVVRYLADQLNQTGYDQVFLVGRAVSAAADILTCLVVFLIALKLFKRWSIAVLSAGFSSFSVLQIQQAHFFTVDVFANLFLVLCLYILVLVQQQKWNGSIIPAVSGKSNEEDSNSVRLTVNWSSVWLFVAFGLALGMATASKISYAPIAVLLPIILVVEWLQLSQEQQRPTALLMIRNTVIAAMVSLLTFRILQPYSFAGPGFFGLLLNEKWLNNMRELSQMSAGNVDFPPALQWARRPVTFAFKNMVLWGMGAAWGITAWISFFYMGWKVIKGLWRPHLILWGWTAIYFTMQSLNFTRSMRYQLPVYPTLAIIAGWGLITLWDRASKQNNKPKNAQLYNLGRFACALLIIAILAATFLYGFGFTQIYTKPVTRVAASEWIYQNVPAPINLKIRTDGSVLNHPLPFKNGRQISLEQPLTMAFTPLDEVYLLDVSFTYVIDPILAANPKTLIAQVSTDVARQNVISTGLLADTFQAQPDPRGKLYTVTFAPNILLDKNTTYYLHMYTYEDGESLKLSGPITLNLLDGETETTITLADPVEALDSGMIYETMFSPVESGILEGIHFPHIVDWSGDTALKTLEIRVAEYTPAETELVELLIDEFSAGEDVRGSSYNLDFPAGLSLDKNRQYRITIKNLSDTGTLAFYGSKQANESSWDDPLPVSLHGFSPFDYTSGIYRTELNFEMYWDEDETKRERFINILDQADYLFISSSRQWGSVVQIPERYPLANTYYRELIGCPSDTDIYQCYSDAVPGMFTGNLGFELIQTFQSEPTIGNFQLNTQYAEEAFTVYDHPKVLIFQKSDAYSSKKIRDIFNAVDLSQVNRLTPKEASKSSINPILNESQKQLQNNGGTWSQLFNRNSIVNRLPVLSAALWYGVLILLGLVCYPITRVIFPGLKDKGYSISKIIGLLALAWLTWILGSAGIGVSKWVITLVFGGLAGINLVIFFRNRIEIIEQIRQNKNLILTVEVISLSLFLLFLLIRLGNPDLWHPYKGGEKPMDFSYLNAVIKSSIYPPYDPWFADGYINYYYYGFVIFGVLIKWLGIMPSIGYNLLLITVFCFTGTAAFTLGWQFFNVFKEKIHQFSLSDQMPDKKLLRVGGIAAGIVTIVMYQIIGNFGTVKMIWQGFQKLADGYFEDAGLITKLGWTFEGFARTFTGQKLPYPPGEWYWIPSRAIPGDVITEFPAFTFLYGDPHAHLMALPITLLAILWAVSFIQSRLAGYSGNIYKKLLPTGMTLVGGAWIVGMLRPTNTWDYYTYLVLCCLVILYTGLRYLSDTHSFSDKKRWIILGLAILGFVVLSSVFFKPFSNWYGQAYTKVNLWKGDKSPLGSYLIHWGYLLSVITTWFTWETRNWMAVTPLSALSKIRSYRSVVYSILVLVAMTLLALIILGIPVALVVIPLGIWAILLIARKNQDDLKRFVLFLIGTGLALTLVVELIVIEGDVGRMNTVFKFYLQAWTMLSLGAAAGLIWIIHSVLNEWLPKRRSAWLILMTLITGAVLLYPLLAGTDKINDRISDNTPHTLDGTAFMDYSTYFENGVDMDLSQDYRAIKWMQDNVQGSPVIIEANIPEYRWGSRYSIYTGLPGVVGWNWHQRQQRAISGTNQVFDRVAQVGEFYQTTDSQIAENFLERYDIAYIIVGQLERVTYPDEGIRKFSEWQGKLWEQVYQDDQTTIYRVIKGQ